jgi:predicted Zn-dependent protease
MKIRYPICAVLILLFTSCVHNAITGSKGLTLIPESEMIGMSLTEYKQFISKNNTLPSSDTRVQKVREIGSKVQKAVEDYYRTKNLSKELKNFQWEFNVVEDKSVNAWCMPGGKVVVYTGILPITQNDASLAIVMGHEIAHAIARHGNQRMSQALLLQVGGAAMGVALSQKPQLTQNLFLQSFGIGGQLGVLAFSRRQETEADKMGMIFSAMAGYNPTEAVDFWKRMATASQGSGKPPEFLSTHPSDTRRIKDIRTYLPKAMKYYKPA